MSELSVESVQTQVLTAPLDRPSIDTPVDLPSDGALTVPCLHCGEDVRADSFEHWYAGSRLVSAGCLSCGRRVTLTEVTLRRWTRCEVDKLPR